MWKLTFRNSKGGRGGRPHLAYVTFATELYIYAKFGKNWSYSFEVFKGQTYKQTNVQIRVYNN